LGAEVSCAVVATCACGVCWWCSSSAGVSNRGTGTAAAASAMAAASASAAAKAASLAETEEARVSGMPPPRESLETEVTVKTAQKRAAIKTTELLLFFWGGGQANLRRSERREGVSE